MVHLFMGVLGSGRGAWACGLHDTLEHMSVPLRALRLGTRCVFQVSSGSEQGRAFLGSGGGGVGEEGERRRGGVWAPSPPTETAGSSGT